jgi:hypothetical protein
LRGLGQGRLYPGLGVKAYHGSYDCSVYFLDDDGRMRDIVPSSVRDDEMNKNSLDTIRAGEKETGLGAVRSQLTEVLAPGVSDRE